MVVWFKARVCQEGSGKGLSCLTLILLYGFYSINWETQSCLKVLWWQVLSIWTLIPKQGFISVKPLKFHLTQWKFFFSVELWKCFCPFPKLLPVGNWIGFHKGLWTLRKSLNGWKPCSNFFHVWIKREVCRSDSYKRAMWLDLDLFHPYLSVSTSGPTALPLTHVCCP